MLLQLLCRVCCNICLQNSFGESCLLGTNAADVLRAALPTGNMLKTYLKNLLMI